MKTEITSIERKEKISFELKPITMPLREEFMDLYAEAQTHNPPKWSKWCSCVRLVTHLTDDDLLKLTDQDIIQIAMEMFIEMNHKQKKKK